MPKGDKYLGIFELQIMLIMLMLQPEANGYAVVRELSEGTNAYKKVGAVYTTIGRLEEKGLLVRTSFEGTSHRSPVNYGVTEKGRSVLKLTLDLITQLSNKVDL